MRYHFKRDIYHESVPTEFVGVIHAVRAPKKVTPYFKVILHLPVPTASGIFTAASHKGICFDNTEDAMREREELISALSEECPEASEYCGDWYRTGELVEQIKQEEIFFASLPQKPVKPATPLPFPRGDERTK